MSLGNAFQPGILAQTTVSVGAASAFTVIPSTTGGTGQFASGGESVEVWNSGTLAVFVEFCGGGNPTIAATVANSYPVGPGQVKVVAMHPGDSGVSCIGAGAGPTTVYFTRGNGI